MIIVHVREQGGIDLIAKLLLLSPRHGFVLIRDFTATIFGHPCGKGPCVNFEALRRASLPTLAEGFVCFLEWSLVEFCGKRRRITCLVYLSSLINFLSYIVLHFWKAMFDVSYCFNSMQKSSNTALAEDTYGTAKKILEAAAKASGLQWSFRGCGHAMHCHAQSQSVPGCPRSEDNIFWTFKLAKLWKEFVCFNRKAPFSQRIGLELARPGLWKCRTMTVLLFEAQIWGMLSMLSMLIVSWEDPTILPWDVEGGMLSLWEDQMPELDIELGS